MSTSFTRPLGRARPGSHEQEHEHEPGRGQGAISSSTRAFVLGAVSGLRTFGALAALGARGRLGGRVGRFAFPALLAGEFAGDKLPAIPPRSDPPAMAGRVAAGALAGRTIAGAPGAGVGAAGAAASTYLSEQARAALVKHTRLPDPLLGAVEDVLAVAVAAAASRGRESETTPEPVPELRPKGPSRLVAVARGLAASATGTAAMTTVQVAYYKATDASPSDAPEKVARRIVHTTLHRRVSRKHRPALNQGMHFLYGTSWGLPFGLVAGTRSGRISEAAGLALGAAVWAVGLAELPALKLAPPPWKQSPDSLGTDLAFHLAYGAATGAAYKALGG